MTSLGLSLQSGAGRPTPAKPASARRSSIS
jgi:hypothetical protein